MSHRDLALGNSFQSKPGFPQPEKWLLRQIFKAIGPAPVRFVLKDGEELSPPGVSPVATIFIRDYRTLAKLVVDPEMAFGDAYANGLIEVQGDLAAALEAVYWSWPGGRADRSWYQRLTSKWLDWLQDNSPAGSRNNIHQHYDLGNDFYRLWLDSEMVYTCAYFPSPSVTLEAAQEAKLDYICRKLQLRPGEQVVEAGCGWGALALHMAQHYGVSVTAYNVSHEQIAHARQRASERGLGGRVQFIEDDYRTISTGSGADKYDVFVSVGMLEHVGVRHFPEFGDVITRAIGDQGRGLLHFIGRSYRGEFSRWIRRRIFPGAHAPTISEVMHVLEPRRYAVLDVENLRMHYAKTLEHWLERFEGANPEITAMYDPRFTRAWRLYLAGSLAAFRASTLQLFQISFAGAKCSATSWSRAHLYESKCARGTS